MPRVIDISHQTSALAVGDVVIEVSQDFYRPTDVVNLWGDPTKAKAKLGWNPNKTSFEELVKIMVESDIAKVAFMVHD